MHELALTQYMLAKALEKAKEAKAKRIIKINVVFGDIYGVVDQFMKFYFNLLGEDTIAAQASLSFQRRPVKLRCRDCNAIFSPKGIDWACPKCLVQSYNVDILSGRECYIESLEVE